jgi:FkbM family methyltransferase
MPEAELCLITTPKSFADRRADRAQVNAIRSWRELGPSVHVVVAGMRREDEPRIATLGVDVVRGAAVNEQGTPLLNDIIAQAEAHLDSRHICYVNADIILPPGFVSALERVWRWNDNAVVAGERVELDIPFDLLVREGWWSELQKRVASEGAFNGAGPDYFAFPRGFLREMPPFAVGRTAFDNWLVWWARHRRVPVVDITKTLTVIHQTHTNLMAWHDLLRQPEVVRNRKMVSWWQSSYTLADCTHDLIDGRVVSRGLVPHAHRVAVSRAELRARVRRTARAALRGERHSRLVSALLVAYYRTPDHTGKLRLFGLARRVGRHRRLTVTLGNRLITLEETDLVQREVLATGAYEPEVWEALRDHVRGNDVVWDVGAHVGVFAIAALGEPGVRCVVCFEPDPRLADVLESNLGLNSDESQLHRVALSSSTGRAPFHLAPAANAGLGSLRVNSGSETIEVESRTADELVYEHGVPAPTLLKLDVEDTETDVLLGAQRLLAEMPPRAIVFEATPAGDLTPADTGITARLEAAGYTLAHIPRRKGLIDVRENYLAILDRTA